MARTGGHKVNAPKRKGYGTQLIESLCPYELHGNVHLTFDPDDIIYKIRGDHDLHANDILEGGWDLDRALLADSIKFQSICEHFQDGVAWEDTGLFGDYAARFRRGEIVRGANSLARLKRQYDTRVEAVFRDLGATGFRIARDLLGRPTNLPHVHIGRGGEILYGTKGNHRLAMAKLLSSQSHPLSRARPPRRLAESPRGGVGRRGSDQGWRAIQCPCRVHGASGSRRSLFSEPIESRRGRMTGHAQAVKSWLGQGSRRERERVWGRLPIEPTAKPFGGETSLRNIRVWSTSFPGQRILELGAAEGRAFPASRAEEGKGVCAGAEGGAARGGPKSQGVLAGARSDVGRCEMVLGNIKEHLQLLKSVDTLLAVRSIYYLRGDLIDVFDAVGRHVPNVVLCGNRNRARKYAELHGNPDDPLGKDNYFATLEGMTSLLEGCGYTIVTIVADGDPIVVGAKTISPAN